VFTLDHFAYTFKHISLQPNLLSQSIKAH